MTSRGAQSSNQLQRIEQKSTRIVAQVMAAGSHAPVFSLVFILIETHIVIWIKISIHHDKMYQNVCVYEGTPNIMYDVNKLEVYFWFFVSKCRCRKYVHVITSCWPNRTYKSGARVISLNNQWPLCSWQISLSKESKASPKYDSIPGLKMYNQYNIYSFFQETKTWISGKTNTRDIRR